MRDKIRFKTILHVSSKKPRESFLDFVVGFDLGGQEDLGRPLIDFAQILIDAKLKYPNLK